MNRQQIVSEILKRRGYEDNTSREAFLEPNYTAWKHDAFLLPDMRAAVDRIKLAKEKDELVYIYGDYDIDGLTATSVLLDSFAQFGLRAKAFIPNRFIDGYGLSLRAMDQLHESGAQLIVTVDCGSLSHKEIDHANELGMEVIVTDHHSVAETMPHAVATINPKRTDHTYPFIDLAGVGVAFKLVQALQTELEGLKDGQEKWLLDLVALGTVCDVVSLTDENRANVRWGLEVMKKTRRPGIKALMAVSGVTPSNLTARSLGFGLGPRLNAAGRLETAQLALDLLLSTDQQKALDLAHDLDAMNLARRAEQDRIFKAAINKADELANDPVLIVSDPSWSHGIIGIVAAKLLERYHKPTFVLQELEDGTAKGSARSYGDFSAVEGIRATEHLLIKGGGHKLAAGVTLQTENIAAWRKAVNDFYKSKKLEDQLRHLLPDADVTLEGFRDCDEDLIKDISRLEPYGNGNREPVFCVSPVTIIGRRLMGAEQQHVKYTFSDGHNKTFQAIAFNAADRFTYEMGEVVSVWLELSLNEWQGRRSVEGRLLRLELI
jgi:single-stranded-DNA-specific exonuclease